MTVPENLGAGMYRCPGCGKDYTRSVLGSHMRTQHSIYGGASGRVRRDKRHINRKSSVELVSIPQENGKPTPLKVTVSETMRVAIDQDGGMWIMEKIK